MDRSQLRYPPEVLQLSMYHANIRSRDEAKDYMKRFQQGEGSYIIRPNTTNDPTFVSITVSITPDGECCHAKVYITKQKDKVTYHISEKQRFNTFHELLRYYSEHRIHCTQNIDNIRLKTGLTVQQRQLTLRTNDRPVNFSNGLGTSPKINNNSQIENFNVHTRPPSNTMNLQGRRGTSLSNSPPKDFHNRMRRQDSETTPSHQSYNSDHMHRSVSENDIPVTKYANSDAMQHNVKMMIKCLPPAPLPKLEMPNADNDFYYTHVDVNKNFFQETYQFLKQNELCECGLRLVDSEFPLGWTVHRSQDAPTKHRIFFQHGEVTTWEMPADIVPELNADQIKFIIHLCHDGRCPIPNCLKPRLDREFVRKKPDNTQTLPNNFRIDPRRKVSNESGRYNGLPNPPSEETSPKQLMSTRPVSFDSYPTTVIDPKVGQPTPGGQEPKKK